MSPTEEGIRIAAERVYLVVRQKCGDPEDARDAVQEAVLRYLQRRGTLRFEAFGQFQVWLRRVAENCLSDAFRRQGRMQCLCEGDLVPDAAWRGPDEELSREESGELVRMALSALSDAHRKVICLAHDLDVVNGFAVLDSASRCTFKELAVKLGLDDGEGSDHKSTRAAQAARRRYVEAVAALWSELNSLGVTLLES